MRERCWSKGRAVIRRGNLFFFHMGHEFDADLSLLFEGVG
jgi:hypothetical protein